MRQALPAFLLFLAAWLGVIAWNWLAQPLSGGELAGHAAKIEAILRQLAGGDLAWFPGYLGGTPSATLLSFALSIPVYAPAVLLAPDPLTGMKVTALLLLAAGGLAAFAFGRRLARDPWAGFATGVAFLLAPQILLRSGWQEHMTILVAVPLVPLAFLALLRVAERGTPCDGLLLGVTFSAALLAWAKMGATLALPLAGFALWLFVTRPEARAPLLRGLLWTVPAVLVLGVLPLLPLLRERGFMTVFALEPFAQWQATYSVRTATSWLDRAGDLFAALPRPFGVDHGGYYLGIVGLLAVGGVISLSWHGRRLSPLLAPIRIFVALALLVFWVSFGPRSVLQGHFEFLDVAQNFPDWGIPLHWLALAAQGVVIYWLLPRRPGRTLAFAATFAVYLLVPAFRLLERLPLYGDLRAPDSFWALNGSFAWAVASGLAVVALLRVIPSPRLGGALGAIVLLAAVLDAAPYLEPFSQTALDARTRADYAAIREPLRAGAGRVLSTSSRYLGLDLPLNPGRPLATDALNRYLAAAPSRRLQVAASRSATDMIAFLQLAGVGDVVVDRRDPENGRRYQEWFRAMFPVRFENDSFTVFACPDPLFPAFFASSASPAAPGDREAADALLLAKHQALAVAAPAEPLPANLPSLHTPPVPGRFERLDAGPASTATRLTLAAAGRSGWIVLDQAWHPDWQATVDGVAAPVYRAAGAFPAVAVDGRAKSVTFRFAPPAWYAAALLPAGAGWLLALGLLAAAPLLPAGFRAPRAPRRALADAAAARPPVTRPLAIVPTYNEAETILALAAQILAAHPAIEILVVDDASPDGTARLVGELARGNPRVHLLPRTGKLGLGSAYRAGFRWAADHGFDACVEIDADFSHDPADIPRLLAALDAGADAAIGSRYLDGVRVINWPEHRLLLSAGATRYVRAATGLPLTDATSGFKALRTSALVRLDDREFRAEGYGFQIELHWLLWRAGFRLVELPIVFTERRLGQTKMTAGIAVEAARRVLQLGLRQPSRRPDPA